VRHITEAGLDAIESLLEQLRTVDGLTERKRGVFYRKSSAFLHFHEDDGVAYADVKLDGQSFERRRVGTAAERHRLVSAVRRSV
jgi:hypothetical protein